jgi:hypothetical protein
LHFKLMQLNSMPPIIAVLKITEPSALPTAISLASPALEKIVTKSSSRKIFYFRNN